MKQAMTLVGFAGFCKTDLILYMARVLHILGEKVAIVDRAMVQEIGFSIPNGIYSDDRLDYRGIEVFLNCGRIAMERLPLDEFTVILVDFGIHFEGLKDIQNIQTLFVVSDLQRHHILPLSSWLTKIQSFPDAVRVLRDVPSGKISARYVDSILQIGKYTNLIAEYAFHLDGTEYENRLKSQYDDVFRFVNIQKTYKGMIIDCMVELFGKEKKTAMKAVKKAQRGR